MDETQVGSEWRQWDLHLHTPSSFDYQDKSVTNKEIVEALTRAEVAVAAVTDHHTIDVDRILELQRIGNGSVTFFPGIELRSELGGSESVHFIGIFPPCSEQKLRSMWTKIEGQLGLTRDDIFKATDERIFCYLKKAEQLFHSLGGLVSIHAGSKSNSIENITNAISYKMAVKVESTNRLDIFEIGKSSDIKEYREKVFPHLTKVMPMIIGSDNHNARNYTRKERCWIKADPTFEGLKQIIVEPLDRVFVGQAPEKLMSEAENRSHYIHGITIGSIDDKHNGRWFGVDIKLNSGLIAVIGKKGSGKSAFADIVALSGQSHIDPEGYSFLTRKKFRLKRLASDFEAKISWKDGTTNLQNLGDDTEIGSTPQRVQYLPQKYVETICNETGVSEEFQKEIDKVVFSFVPREKQLHARNLKELISKRTEVIDQQLVSLRGRLREKISQFVDITRKSEQEYLKHVESLHKEKADALKALQAPPEVVKPNEEPDADTQKRIQQLSERTRVLTDSINSDQQSLTDVNVTLSLLDTVEGKINNLVNESERVRLELVEQTELLGIDVDKLFKISTDMSQLEGLRVTTQKNKLILDKNLGNEPEILNDSDTSMNSIEKREKVRKELDEIRSGLNEMNRSYQEYLRSCAKVNERKIELIGKEDDKSLSTIKGVENELNYIKSELSIVLKLHFESLIEFSIEIHTTIIKKKAIFVEIYEKLVEFIAKEQDHELTSLDFKVGLECGRKQFQKNFLSHINRNLKGSFRGVAESEVLVSKLLDSHRYETKEEIKEFLLEVINYLKNDRSESLQVATRIRDQVLKGQNEESDLYYDVLSLEYLDINYMIHYDSKDLSSNVLSPGEKGAVLLIFYLLVDQSNIPLIIDQPEENLDNESIVEILVPYVKRARKRRQVIIVTHNPNLAVVCDAEQIICCEMIKAKDTFNYSSGSIEDPTVNSNLVNVLEGTMPAFRKRDSKYSL